MTQRAVLGWLATAGYGALAMALGGPAAAQTAGDGATTREEVIVTARKRDERAQDLPIAVSAITRTDISERGIENLEEVAKRVPGLFYSSGLSTADFRPSIRGMQVVRTTAQPSVGVYVDGIDTGYGLGYNLQSLDVERIEVVRGPQSALFGRSVIGGAVNYISRRPSDSFEGSLSAYLGEGGEEELSGRLSGPLSETVAASIAARVRSRDGFYTNLASGRKAGEGDSQAVAAGLSWEPNERFDLFVRLFWASEYDGQPAWNNVPSNTTVPRRAPATPTPWFVGEVPTSAALVRHNADAYIDFAGYDREYRRASLIANWDAGFATLTGIAAVNSSEVRFDQDTDFSFAPTFFAGTSVFGDFRGKFDEKVEDHSLEVRLTSPGDRRFRWLAGIYYAHEEAKRTTFNFTELTLNPARARLSPQNREATTSALFASVDFDVTDKLTLGLEARFNRDELAASTIERITTTDVAYAGARTFESTTPRVTALYKVTDTFRLYANVARGFKPGGFNVASGAGAISLPANLRTFRPEEATSVEAGFKSELLDGRLILNGAYFAIDWTDLQVGATFGTPPFTAGYTANAGEVEIRGFEVEASWAPTDWLDLSFNLSRQPAKILGFVDSRTAALATVGDKLPGSPATTATLSAFVNHDVSDTLEIFGGVDVRYRSSFYATNANLAQTGDATTFDLQAGVQWGSLRATAFLLNAGDDDTPGSLNAFVNPTTFARSFLAAVPDPRRAGLRLTWDF